MTFGERFQDRCEAAVYPVCLGLDPRVDEMPAAIRDSVVADSTGRDDAIRRCIARYHEVAISAVADLVPAVKLQLAFYEQYGIPGMTALLDTIAAARRAGLLVIADGKRNDIASTAKAYAHAFLGRPSALGEAGPAFDADALTVNPYLGWDSLVPFAEAAREHGKGLFVLVHTSNPSSVEIQEAAPGDEPIYLRVARQVSALGDEFFDGQHLSSVGAIVGCTFPEAAGIARRAMPRSPIVVVGYGAQEGTLPGCVACFDERGAGAVVNSSRSLTYGADMARGSEEDVVAAIRSRTEQLGRGIATALTAAAPSRQPTVE